MDDINNLISQFRAITAKNSITPDSLGALLQAIVDALANSISSSEKFVADISQSANSYAITITVRNNDNSSVSANIPTATITKAGAMSPSHVATIQALEDSVEQLNNDIGDLDTALSGAASIAYEALAASYVSFLDFDGFDNDDAGYSDNGISSQPAVRVLYHSLYKHFEARVSEGGRLRTVKRWKGAEAFNIYDGDGNPSARTTILYRLGSRFFAVNRSTNNLDEL